MPIQLTGRTHPEDREYFTKFVIPHLTLLDVIERDVADHAKGVNLLRGARALVCPIDGEEPFGFVAIEATLCGTPVLGFARGSFPEIVEQYSTGFLAPRGDVEALASAAIRLRTFDREGCAQQACERFSTFAMASAYESVYERAIAIDRFARARVA